MNWNWNLTEDGTQQIYNGNALYWEIDGCYNYTEKEQEETAKEAIKEFSYLLREL